MCNKCPRTIWRYGHMVIAVIGYTFYRNVGNNFAIAAVKIFILWEHEIYLYIITLYIYNIYTVLRIYTFILSTKVPLLYYINS